MMIHVQRYDDAYNFIKFWLATADYRANHGTLDCKEFSLKDQDPTENILEFMKFTKCLVRDCLFYVYLIIIKMNTIKEISMQDPGNKPMISEQQGHLEMYLQFIHSHYPGFLWNFVNFDYFEEDFIIPDKPKFKGQAHHMFSRFLNLLFFSRNFLCFVFLQGRRFLLRSKNVSTITVCNT